MYELWEQVKHYAIGFLIISVALYLGVHFIEMVWVPLVIIGSAALLVGGLVTVWRRRSRGW